MKILIALGGNAILQRNEPLEADIQRKNIAIASQLIATVSREHDVIVTHGNGPQVGLLALQNDSYKEVSPYPLDILGAESEGMIGYLLLQELKNCLPKSNIVSLLTQTLVSADDPAFTDPTKFVGPVYTKEKADQLSHEKNWTMRADGDYFRRVVPSPIPKAIIEENVIDYLTKLDNTLVICVGGGGIPVCQDENNKLRGVEAVVDKDLASNVLAQALGIDLFIMLTDVSAVETHFKQPHSKKIKCAAPDQLSTFKFAQGSMAPKVQAAVTFANSCTGSAAIGSLGELREIMSGDAGTHIGRKYQGISYY